MLVESIRVISLARCGVILLIRSHSNALRFDGCKMDDDIRLATGVTTPFSTRAPAHLKKMNQVRLLRLQPIASNLKTPWIGCNKASAKEYLRVSLESTPEGISDMLCARSGTCCGFSSSNTKSCSISPDIARSDRYIEASTTPAADCFLFHQPKRHMVESVS